ncbi:hypothetical protein [Phenylobacterium sp.]|uniref:hypothetical protein n=1 Tax=Phenylobacterium sp. TaxID=1871053 RepID=UPI00403748B1
MTDRPILFSAPMVRALLSGAKTQTRRIVKFDGLLDFEQGADGVWQFRTAGGVTAVRCPYGVPGDRLWVKETWRPFEAFQPWDLDIRYHADGELRTIKDGEFGEGDWTMPKHAARGNVSPLFMPRFASRITLEITGVRVERLAAISEADAEAEGVQEPTLVPSLGAFWSSRDGFARLWNHINGPSAWAANPWVWVVEFKRIEAAHG